MTNPFALKKEGTLGMAGQTSSRPAQGCRQASAPQGDPSGGRASSLSSLSTQQHPCDVLRTPSLGEWVWNGPPPPGAPDGHACMAPGYPESGAGQMRQSAFQAAVMHGMPEGAFPPESGRELPVRPPRAFSLPGASFCRGPCPPLGSAGALSSPMSGPRIQGSRTWSLPATSLWSPIAPDAIVQGDHDFWKDTINGRSVGRPIYEQAYSMQAKTASLGSTESNASALTTIECSFLSPANSVYGSQSLLGVPMWPNAAALQSGYDTEVLIGTSTSRLGAFASAPQGGFAAGCGMYTLAEGVAVPGGDGAQQPQVPAAAARAPNSDMRASFGAEGSFGALPPLSSAPMLQPGAVPSTDILWPKNDTMLSAQQDTVGIMDCAMDCSPLSSLRLSLLLEDMQDLAGARKTLRSGEVDRDMLGSLGPLGSLGIPGSLGMAMGSFSMAMGSLSMPMSSLGMAMGSLSMPLGSLGMSVGSLGVPGSLGPLPRPGQKLPSLPRGMDIEDYAAVRRMLRQGQLAAGPGLPTGPGQGPPSSVGMLPPASSSQQSQATAMDIAPAEAPGPRACAAQSQQQHKRPASEMQMPPAKAGPGQKPEQAPGIDIAPLLGPAGQLPSPHVASSMPSRTPAAIATLPAHGQQALPVSLAPGPHLLAARALPQESPLAAPMTRAPQPPAAGSAQVAGTPPALCTGAASVQAVAAWCSAQKRGADDAPPARMHIAPLDVASTQDINAPAVPDMGSATGVAMATPRAAMASSQGQQLNPVAPPSAGMEAGAGAAKTADTDMAMPTGVVDMGLLGTSAAAAELQCQQQLLEAPPTGTAVEAPEPNSGAACSQALTYSCDGLATKEHAADDAVSPSVDMPCIPTNQAETTHLEDSGDAQTSVEVKPAKREHSQGPSASSRSRRAAAGNSEYVPESVLRNRMIQKNYLQRRKSRRAALLASVEDLEAEHAQLRAEMLPLWSRHQAMTRALPPAVQQEELHFLALMGNAQKRLYGEDVRRKLLQAYCQGGSAVHEALLGPPLTLHEQHIVKELPDQQSMGSSVVATLHKEFEGLCTMPLDVLEDLNLKPVQMERLSAEGRSILSALDPMRSKCIAYAKELLVQLTAPTVTLHQSRQSTPAVAGLCDELERVAVSCRDMEARATATCAELLTTRQAVKLKRVTKGHPGAHAALCAQVHYVHMEELAAAAEAQGGSEGRSAARGRGSQKGGRGGGAAKSGARGRSKAQDAAEAKPVHGRRSTRSLQGGARGASADKLSEEEDDMLKAPAVEEGQGASPRLLSPSESPMKLDKESLGAPETPGASDHPFGRPCSTTPPDGRIRPSRAKRQSRHGPLMHH